MSNVPFKAAGGLDVAGGDLKLGNIGTGAPGAGGRIISLDGAGVAHYRTFQNMKADIDEFDPDFEMFRNMDSTIIGEA